MAAAQDGGGSDSHKSADGGGREAAAGQGCCHEAVSCGDGSVHACLCVAQGVAEGLVYVRDGVGEGRRARRLGADAHRETLIVVGESQLPEARIQARDALGDDAEDVFVGVVVVEQDRQGDEPAGTDAEVEAALLTHAAVAECGVVGCPDEERGQIVKAYVVLRAGQTGDAAMIKTLQDFVKATVAPYKYPRAIEFVTELPKTQTGKLQRFELRRMAAAGASQKLAS